LKFDNVVYEVEFRCHFDSIDEASALLPFLLPNLNRRCTWRTAIHGLSYFQSGKLIRTARVVDDKGPRYYVGWKGPDSGQFANIRQEVDEKITPTTSSSILRFLGGKAEVSSLKDVTGELDRLGHSQFMEFEGEDSSGYNEQYAVHLKLMTCRKLKWPLIVEMEKTANTLEEAARCEQSLYALCREFHLQDRMVREEPPTLLYNVTFPR
jgi:hypothetical protein